METLIALLTFILLTHSTAPRIREYQFVATTKTWNEAKTFCQENYNTNLATILTKDDLNSAIFTIPIIIGHPMTRVWIGLNDVTTEGEWEWSDGTLCQIDNTTGGHDCSDFWYLGEPNDSGGNEDCGDLWYHSDAWVINDAICDNTNSFLCNKPFEYTYVYNGTFLNWAQAEANCNKYHGGMATIQTTANYISAINAIPLGVKSVWIGLNDLETEGIWEWSNGDECTANNNISHDCSVFWTPGEPNDWNSGEDCGELWYYDTTGDWLLNDNDCVYGLSSLCIESNTAHPTVQPTPDIQNAHFALSLTQRTWAESLVYCEQRYYGLAAILNELELDEVVSLMPNNVEVMKLHYAWIGLNDLKQEAVWEWSDGSECAIRTDNCTDLWDNGEPNNKHEKGENCGQLLWVSVLGEWRINDKMCDYTYAALCSKNETTANPTTYPTLSPTVKPTKLPTFMPTLRPSDVPSMLNNTKDGNVGNASSGMSTLDNTLIAVIVILLVALGGTCYCLINFKQMHKSIGQMGEYVGQNANQTDAHEVRLVPDDETMANIN